MIIDIENKNAVSGIRTHASKDQQKPSYAQKIYGLSPYHSVMTAMHVDLWEYGSKSNDEFLFLHVLSIQ